MHNRTAAHGRASKTAAVLVASVLVVAALATQGTSAYAATTSLAPTVQNVAPDVNSATLSWTAPASDGGSPITGYVVFPYIGFAPQGFRVFMSTATTQLIRNLTSGTTYRFKVAAINAIGIGALSKISSPVTPIADFPGAPVIGIATAGDASAAVSWTAPSSDGGSPITAYIVTPYVGYAAQNPTRFDSTTTTRTVRGLTNGTQYRFRVQAVNAVGSGGYSKVTNVVTPLLQIPTILSVGVAHPFGDSGPALPQVNIDWGSWRDPAIGTVYDGEVRSASGSISSLSPMINYASSIPPSPSSYRASACLNGVCVTGPWWHPPVSPSILNSPPSVTVSRDQLPGIHVTIDPSGHTDAPVLAVQRDGRTVQLLTPQSNAFTDLGAFQSPTATYTAVACYSDCTGGSIDDGFAQTTPKGPAAQIATPLVASVSVACNPAQLTVGENTNCDVVVTGGLNHPMPTGTVQVFVELGGNSTLVSICTLDPTGRCSATVTVPPGSTGNRLIGAFYSGDANYNPANNGTPVTIS